MKNRILLKWQKTIAVNNKFVLYKKPLSTRKYVAGIFHRLPLGIFYYKEYTYNILKVDGVRYASWKMTNPPECKLVYSPYILKEVMMD